MYRHLACLYLYWAHPLFCVCDVYHRQWDAIFRGGMVLETPNLSYIGPSEARRMFCVTTIRRDARTGAVRVTVAGKLVLRENTGFSQ